MAPPPVLAQALWDGPESHAHFVAEDTGSEKPGPVFIGSGEAGRVSGRLSPSAAESVLDLGHLTPEQPRHWTRRLPRAWANGLWVE